MNSNDFLNEDIVTDANDMHQDHEVQMARQECYHAAERAIAVHKLLRHVNEAEGLEGWVSAKITLANDYLKTVHDYLEYQLMTMNSPVQAEVLPIAESQQGVAEDASAGASSSGSVATVVKGGKGGTNLLGGPEYKGPNPFKKKKSK